MGKILIIAQILDGQVKKSTNSAVTFAARLASFLGTTYSIMALGDNLSAQTGDLVRLGGDKVLTAESQGLDQAIAEHWSPIIEYVVRNGPYKFIVGPSSSKFLNFTIFSSLDKSRHRNFLTTPSDCSFASVKML